MTSSKSDLEAKEGQIPNESNFLEFVSLLGSLSTRGGGAGKREDERPKRKEDAGAAEEGEPERRGRSSLHPRPLSSLFIGSESMQMIIFFRFGCRESERDLRRRRHDNGEQRG